MNKNKILTTTIGSFPKPDYLPIMDWFDSARGEDGMNTVKTTIEYTKYHNKKNESDELLFKRAANEVCLLYTSPSPRDRQKSRMPSSA